LTAYYNENDTEKAAWIRELIRQNVVAPGEVDERDIQQVDARDLRGFTQCHFFAGIAVWSYALRISGWPDDRPCWTGSCPCGPFSVAGHGLAFTDERHLWPYWFDLIEKSRPICLFGEQVENAIKHGWLDLVQDDLEAIAYAVGAVGLPAACSGAPHIRPRIFFMANSAGEQERAGLCHFKQATLGRLQPANSSKLGDTDRIGESTPRVSHSSTKTIFGEARQATGARGFLPDGWRSLEWIECRDGKRRPTKPGLRVLAHGATNRVLKLRGYGDAICAETAKAFIEAAVEVLRL
jgi:DNA (cytosine-5)-methyltransferase 1